MRIRLLFVLCCFSTLIVSAQEQTRTEEPAPEFSTFGQDSVTYKLMIVPFEPKLYRSEIDRFIGKENGLNFNEIRGYFRLGLDNALVIASKKNYETFTMHADVTDVNRDLLYIYKSIGYQFKALPPPEPVASEETGAKKWLEKLEKLKKAEPKPEEMETRVEAGQVLTTGSMNDKYMAAKVINPNMLDFLSKKYESELFLFITQLDLINSPDNSHVDYGLEDYTRLIRVHYTVLDKKGNEVTGGRAEKPFSSQTNDIRKIIKMHFTEVADSIVSDLEAKSLVSDSEEVATPQGN